MYWIFYLITFLYIRIVFPCKVVGKQNFEKRKPVIVVCNHRSNVDVLYLQEYLPEKKFFLAKKELFKNKVFSWIIKTGGAVPIDRQNIDFGAIKTSLQILKNQKKLVIFPEGMRNKTGDDLQALKNGAAMLAIKAKVDILPMYIQKRGKAFRRNKLIVGKAFSLAEFYDQKLSAEVLDKASKIIAENLDKIKQENQN